MRIGIDARFYGIMGKGLGRYTAKLIEHLERVDERNEYVVFLRRENYADYIPRSERFTKSLADYRWYGWREQILFPRHLARCKLDLIHFPHFNVPLFYRRPFLVTIHDLILFHYPTPRGSTLSAPLYAFKYFIYRIVIASAIRRAKRVITVSQFTADDIIRSFSHLPISVSVTPEAVEKRCAWSTPEECEHILRENNLYDVHERKPVRFVLYVGNAYPHKNLESLLSVAPSFPAIQFVLVGRDDFFLLRLKHAASQAGLTNVLFVGEKSDRELAVLYRTATLYVFPSLYEGFGLPPLEAFTYGLPVLAARRGALPEIMGAAGRFYDPKQPDALRRALTEALGETMTHHPTPAMLATLARFDWERMAKETKALYDQVGRLL